MQGIRPDALASLGSGLPRHLQSAQQSMLSPRKNQDSPHNRYGNGGGSGPYFNSPQPQSRPMGSSAQLSTGHIPDQWHVSNGIDPDGNVYDPMDDVDEGDFVEDDIFEDDDIIGAEDAEEVREHDLTLLAARSYGRKTPQQREEASARLQRLNTESEGDSLVQAALDGLRQASLSQGVSQLANHLQESLHTLICSREKSRSGGHVRFKANEGSATQGSYTTVGIVLGNADVHGKCIIKDVLPGSPAHLVGKFEKGDTIMKVDTEDVSSKNIVEKIRGSDLPGSPLSITVTRVGRKRPLVVSVLRATKESVDNVKKTYEMISELAQLSGADDKPIEGPASDLEKKLTSQLDTLEHEKMQQEILLQEQEMSFIKTMSAVQALVAEFSSIVASRSFSPLGGSQASPVDDSSRSTARNPTVRILRDAALKVGRQTQVLEESCSALRARISGKLMGMDGRLRRLDEITKRVSESNRKKGEEKIEHLHEGLAYCEDQLQEYRRQNFQLTLQIDERDLKIALLESKIRVPLVHPQSGSAEPGGPVLENSAEESKRLTGEVNALKEELSRRQREHEDALNERNRSLEELSSSLLATQDRVSASMSELVILRKENLIFKEQNLMETQRTNAEHDEYTQLKAELEKQTNAIRALEVQHMQTQQKYVQASEELARKTKELHEKTQRNERNAVEIKELHEKIERNTVEFETINNKESQKVANLKEMLHRENEEVQELRTKLAVSQGQLQSVQAEFAKEKTNMQETFNRERQEGLQVLRERDVLKKQRDALKTELQKHQQSSQLNDVSRTSVEMKDKREEVLQVQRERDSLKVDLDESRYLINQLTAENNMRAADLEQLRKMVGRMESPSLSGLSHISSRPLDSDTPPPMINRDNSTTPQVQPISRVTMSRMQRQVMSQTGPREHHEELASTIAPQGRPVSGGKGLLPAPQGASGPPPTLQGLNPVSDRERAGRFYAM